MEIWSSVSFSSMNLERSGKSKLCFARKGKLQRECKSGASFWPDGATLNKMKNAGPVLGKIQTSKQPSVDPYKQRVCGRSILSFVNLELCFARFHELLRKCKFGAPLLREVQTLRKVKNTSPVLGSSMNFRKSENLAAGFVKLHELQGKCKNGDQVWAIPSTSKGMKIPSLVLLSSMNFRRSEKHAPSSRENLNFRRNEKFCLSFRQNPNFKKEAKSDEGCSY